MQKAIEAYEALNNSEDNPEKPVTKQPKPVTVPDNVDDDESLPF